MKTLCPFPPDITFSGVGGMKQPLRFQSAVKFDAGTPGHIQDCGDATCVLVESEAPWCSVGNCNATMGHWLTDPVCSLTRTPLGDYVCTCNLSPRHVYVDSIVKAGREHGGTLDTALPRQSPSLHTASTEWTHITTFERGEMRMKMNLLLVLISPCDTRCRCIHSVFLRQLHLHQRVGTFARNGDAIWSSVQKPCSTPSLLPRVSPPLTLLRCMCPQSFTMPRLPGCSDMERLRGCKSTSRWQRHCGIHTTFGYNARVRNYILTPFSSPIYHSKYMHLWKRESHTLSYFLLLLHNALQGLVRLLPTNGIHLQCNSYLLLSRF